jgi:hypothetical protein
MDTKQQQLEKAERAWYRAKARAEQAADRVSECERKVARLREEMNCAEVLGGRPPGLRSQNADNARKTGGALMAQKRFRISFTEREHATILAALRLWQEADEYNRGDLRDIAEAAGVPLSNKEIDVLCERVNFTSNREA